MFKWLIGDSNRGAQERQAIADAYIARNDVEAIKGDFICFASPVSRFIICDPFLDRIREIRRAGHRPKAINLPEKEWDIIARSLHYRSPFVYDGLQIGLDKDLPRGACVIETQGSKDRIVPPRKIKLTKEE